MQTYYFKWFTDREGFMNYSNFFKLFQKHNGVCPAKFRKN